MEDFCMKKILVNQSTAFDTENVDAVDFFSGGKAIYHGFGKVLRIKLDNCATNHMFCKPQINCAECNIVWNWFSASPMVSLMSVSHVPAYPTSFPALCRMAEDLKDAVRH